MLACVWLSGAASAQVVPGLAPPASTSVPPTEAAPLAAIPVAEVLPRADAALARLKELEAAAQPDAALQEIAARSESEREDLIAQAYDARRRLKTLRSLDVLRGLESSWRRKREDMAKWSEAVERSAAALDAGYAAASAMQEQWRLTEAAARAAGDAPVALLGRIDGVRSAISRTRKKISDRRVELLRLQELVRHELGRCDALLAELGEGRKALERELLVRESLPLWEVLSQEQQREPLAASLARALEEQTAELRAAWPPALHVWLTLVAIAVASLWWVLALRQRAGRLAEEDPSFEPTARLFERPYSAAIVLASLGLRLVWHDMPGVAEELLQTLILIPALRLVAPVIGPAARSPLFALAAFYVVDRARVLLESALLLERLVFCGEMIAACAVLGWLLRPARVRELPAAAIGGLAWVGHGLRVALALCALALVANAIGFARLGSVVGDGAIHSLFFAVGLYASYRVADGVVAAARRAWPLNLLRAIRHRPFSTRQRTRTLLRVSALAAWAFIALEQFTIRDEIVAGARSVLGASLELGELSLSLGDVLAFGLTIWGALLVSRAIRFLLEEDVFPRLQLPRGVPHAISATFQYLAVLVAFFLGLAVTGINLTQFTILAGAFGVGVGFGLQSVVNGFVSGLILLYERPVQVGDVVQIADLQGTMRRIGIRSSTVRTFEGAEVIVPNANLISERFVNWTLSDRLRRIDIDVGVEYGSDPRRVLELLTGVAHSHPSVLDDPAPLALFTRFGASSLDFQLRAWTENLDDAALVRSDLCVAIVAALEQAGIAIPFPVYDVRVTRSGA
jgi:small-conductance mechanosensitive channel